MKNKIKKKNRKRSRITKKEFKLMLITFISGLIVALVPLSYQIYKENIRERERVKIESNLSIFKDYVDLTYKNTLLSKKIHLDILYGKEKIDVGKKYDLSSMDLIFDTHPFLFMELDGIIPRSYIGDSSLELNGQLYFLVNSYTNNEVTYDDQLLQAAHYYNSWLSYAEFLSKSYVSYLEKNTQ